MTLEKQIKQVAAKWALIKLESSDFLEFMSEKEFSSTDSYNHSIEKVTQILLDMHNSLKYIYEHELQNEATIIPIISEITTTSRELNNLKYKLLDKLSKLKTAKPSNDSETSSEDSEPKNIHINLPKIELEKFNGVYTRYPAFKHQFDAAIDSNNSLSQCQKLQYLKSFLTEEPLNLIRHLDLTNQNYQVAIELLESKYYKYRKIVFDLIDKLLNLKNITSPNSRFYQSLTSTVRQTIAQLKNLSINTDQWNPILVRLVSSKLDAKVHQDWLLTLENHDEIPSLDTLLIFIERQADSYLDSHSFNINKQKVQFKESNSAKSLNVHASNKDLSCKLCLKQHGLWQCEKFKKLSLEERSKFVNQNKLCKKCFSPSHYVNDCKRFNCRCGFKLSPLLHFCSNSKTNSSLKSEGGVVQKDPEDKKAGEQTDTKSSSKTSGHCGVDGSTTLLSRALIKTQDISGREVHIRAFIDTGSEISLISEEIVNQLGLEKQNALLNVKGLKGQHVTSSKGLVNLKIGSIIDDSYELDAPFYVVNSLNLTIPSVPLKRSQFKFISGLPLSDGTFNTPHTTGVLIGADLFSKLMLNDIRKSQDQNLVAQNTSLGWIVFGKAEALYKNDFNFNNKNAHAATTLEEINSNVLKLMDLDSTPDHAADSISNAELQFQFSIKENGSGQLQVALPFKIDPPILGDSLHKALTMLKRQEVKLNSNPLLKEEYFQYFDTLKELNFIELVGPLTMHDKTKNNQQFYLPHFGVYKGENSPLRIVLNWISSPPYKFKTFVSNRITEIQSLDFPHSWSHVPTAENPADLGTRGISVENFLNTEFWKKGYKAHFLSNPTPFKFLNEVKTPEEENKKEVVSFVHSLLKKEEVIDKYLSQFSSLERLVSHLSILKKFCIYLKIKREYPDDYKEKFKNFKTIRPLDRENSLLNLIKYSQISFVTEITSLENQEPLDRKSNILTLNPFLDKFHLLRVGGRLEEANIPYNQKHPLIISKSCYITKLLVRSYHLKYLHAGPNVISALLRLKFWIVQGRKLIRKVCRECITCFKQKPLTYTPLMGNLPGDRVNPSRPFENTGVDFFGPFMVHLNLRRGSKPQKVYVSTFVCFATKACHFEVCTDLSTECFLNALKRFIARRGVPKRIYSDNGTTFVSASKVVRSELNQLISKMKNNEVMKFLSENSICWSFVPTYSPHFGGLWESSVRVCKQYLKRIVGQSFLTLLELETLLCQIESILNSRPLTPLSDDSESLEYLSPGHFLVGQPLVQLPVLEHCQERNCKLNQRFKFLENLKAGFWKAWSNNYLNTLQQRYKGKTKIVNLVVNQLVLIQDKNTLTNQWKLGRVLEVFPGKDGTVRVVKLKTQLGTITRPVVKLAPLPIEI